MEQEQSDAQKHPVRNTAVAPATSYTDQCFITW